MAHTTTRLTAASRIVSAAVSPFILVAGAFLLFLGTTLSHAQSIWTGAALGAGNWSDSGNWIGGVPNGPSAVAIFPASASPVVTVDIPVTVQSIEVLVTKTFFGGPLTFSAAGGQITIAAGMDVKFQNDLVFLGTATVTFGDSNGTLDFASLSGPGGYIQSGGGSVTVFATLGLAGPVLVNSGFLEVGDSSGTSDLFVAPGARVTAFETTWGALSGGGEVLTASRPLTFNQSTDSTFTGTLDTGTGSITKAGSGTLVLSGSTSVGLAVVSGGTLQVGDGVSGTFSHLGVMADGTFAFNLPGTTFVPSLGGSGSVVVKGGTVEGSGTGAWNGTFDVVVDAGATLTARIGTIGDVTVNGAWNTTLADIGSLSGSGTITADGSLEVGDNNADTTFTGSINASGPFAALTKVGTGTLTVSNLITTTNALLVHGGTLRSQGATFAGPVSIFGGATFAGFGTVAAPHVLFTAPGATLAPSGGVLSTGGQITLQGPYVVTIDGPALGTGYGRVATVGPFVAFDPTGPLVLTGSYVPVAGDSFMILDNTAANFAISFPGPAGTLFTLNGVPLRIAYDGGSGNDWTLTVATQTVTSSTSGNGTISPLGGQTVFEGANVPYTLSPDPGYRVGSVTGTCAAGTLAGNAYTTGAVTPNCTVVANFVLDQFTVTPGPAGPNGTITPDTPQVVANGGTTSFTVTPKANYTASVAGNCGPPAGPSSSAIVYTTAQVTADCDVTPIFAVVKHTVTASIAPPGLGGFISPPSLDVDQGSNGTFTVFAFPGYTVTMGGTCPGGSLVGPIYTTGTIVAPCEVVATFHAPAIQVAAPNEALNVILNFLAPRTVGIVATGPSLASYGVAGALANPALTVIDSAEAVIAANDDWQASPSAAAITAAGIAPSSPLESALVHTFDPGTYLVSVDASGTGPGVAAIALHDLTGAPGSFDRFLALDFGSVPTGGTPRLIELSVINTGGLDLEVDAGATSLGGPDAADFSIASNTCSTVAPGSSCTIGLQFAPATLGTRTAFVLIPSNDPIAMLTPMLLSGSGVLPQFTLTAATAGNGVGSITGAGFNCPGDCSETVDVGTTITLSATPAAHSTFTGWSGGGCSGTGTCVVTVAADTSVTATFTLVQHAVTPSAGANGSISPGTVQQVNHGSTATFAVTPSAGFTAAVGGTCGGSLVGTTYTTNAVTQPCTVVASFTQDAFTVTPTAGANGTISPNTPQSVASGGTATFTVTPNAGHEIASVTGCGGALAGNAYTTGPITADCAVTATFQVVNPPRLGNISTRMQVLTGDDVMIGGFVIGGSSSKTVAIVATGPSLTAFGIANPLANPKLTLVRSSDQSVVTTNDDWQAAANQADLVAAGFAPSDALEAAILVTLPPGAYTAIVEGSGGGTGISVVGVYEVDGPEVPLINISTRGRVLTGDDVMIGGFVVNGTGPQTLAIVATGPSLAAFGITSPLANPKITLVRSSDQSVIDTNDDWQGHANASQLHGTGFAPTDALESGIYTTLPPGAYTVIVEGVGAGTGVAVVGVYKVN